jgi:hypothetical protein
MWNSYCLCARHEGVWGIWGVAPLILNLGTRRGWVASCTRRPPYRRYAFSRSLGGCEQIIHLQEIRRYFFSVSVIAVHLILRCTPLELLCRLDHSVPQTLASGCLVFLTNSLANIVIFSNCISGNGMLEVHVMEVVVVQSQNCFLQLFEKDPRWLSRCN